MALIARLQRIFRGTSPTESQPEGVPQALGFVTYAPIKSELGYASHDWKAQSVGPTTFQSIKSSFVQLATALFTIFVCVLRLARLLVGVVLSTFGVVGLGLQLVGSKIAHPDDRRLLPRFGKTE